jgi:hypothetical protein
MIIIIIKPVIYKYTVCCLTPMEGSGFDPDVRSVTPDPYRLITDADLSGRGSNCLTSDEVPHIVCSSPHYQPSTTPPPV